MYRRVVLIIFLILVTNCLRNQTALASEIINEDAEILVIYNNNPSEEESANIQTIVKILTYLQHSVAYVPLEESAPLLEKYDTIICFGLTETPDSFIDKLASDDKRVFLLGSGGVESYISKKGYNFVAHKMEDMIATVHYKFSEKNEFNTLISIKNSILLSGELTYDNGTISIEGKNASLYSRYQNFVYLPLTDLSDPLIQASFTKEVARWLWPFKGDPHPYAQYIVLDEVYPFCPPEQLMEAIDFLVDLKIPFVISVMPIYENGEYPAMKKFYEVLRYAQANGGSILIHSPILQQEQDNVEQIWEYLTTAMEAYTNFGIYPLGIEAPEDFMFSVTGREILKRYSTVFFYQGVNENSIDLNERFNSIYKDGHQIIAPAISLDQSGNSQIMVHSTAIYLKLQEGIDLLKEKVNVCIESNIPMKSLWETDNTVYADNLYLYTVQGQTYFNNEKISLEYIPFAYDDDFDYKNGVFQWIAEDLGGLNKKLVFLVIISSIIFTIFIIFARQMNKRKFLLPKEGVKRK
jgi:uncharacterized protein YdaL